MLKKTMRTNFKMPDSQPKEISFYKNEIIAILKDGIAKLEKHYLISGKSVTIPFPKIGFSKLTGTTAGMAYLNTNTIEFNHALMWRNWDDFKKRTVLHELAHLINHQINGTQTDAHGIKWQIIANLLGCSVKPCHNYETKNSGSITYTCNCYAENKKRIHNISLVNHLKVLKGMDIVCPKCRCKLKRLN